MRPWQALHCLPIAERRSKAQLTVSLSETLIVRLAIVVVAALALVGVASATADVGLLNQTQPGHHVHGDAQEAGQRAENAIDHHGAPAKAPVGDHQPDTNICGFTISHCSSTSALGNPNTRTFNRLGRKDRVPPALDDRVRSRTLDVETPPPRT